MTDRAIFIDLEESRKLQRHGHAEAELTAGNDSFRAPIFIVHRDDENDKTSKTRGLLRAVISGLLVAFLYGPLMMLAGHGFSVVVSGNEYVFSQNVILATMSIHVFFTVAATYVRSRYSS